jgi:hypothetical protein
MLSQIPHHSALLALAVHLLTLYAAIGLMAVGFAIMLGGPPTAAATARFFFIRPLQSLITGSRMLVALVAAAIYGGLVRAIAVIGRGIATELRELVADVRWLIRSR